MEASDFSPGSFTAQTTSGRVMLGAKVRNKTTGRDAYSLFKGVFGAAIESLARTILSKVPGLDGPHMLGQGFLYRVGNQGFSQNKGSALFSYQLPEHVAEAVLQLQGHTTLQMLHSAKELAAHQARIRSAIPG